MSWHNEPMMALDTETTGVNVEHDRIVSAATIHVSRTGQQPRTWLSNVDGQPIPEGATAVHGISTEHAHANGQPAAEVIEQLVTAIAEAVATGIPIVGHNAVYDLSIIDREARRHLGAGLMNILGWHANLAVIDTMVLDRYVAPFRRRVSETQGPYQLRTTASTYGLIWDEKAAHGAEYDALMSARVAWHIGNIASLRRADYPEWVQRLRTQRFSELHGMTALELHTSQMLWAARDAAQYQTWLRTKAPDGKRNPDAVVEGAWPLIPAPATAEEVPSC
ncbi:MAG: exonuclease domain-containing protein [Actinomycetota bacterium]|nr:exonuclease domain-containing protein [Actinomycetota bacterium]